MIKWIKKNLTFKIWLITTILFILICFLTYTFIAYFMPKSYSSQLRAGLDEKVEGLADELKTTRQAESVALLGRFVLQNDVTLQVYASTGELADISAEIYRYVHDETESGSQEGSSWGESDNLESELWDESDSLESEFWDESNNLESELWDESDGLESESWDESDSLESESWDESDSLESELWDESNNLENESWDETNEENGVGTLRDRTPELLEYQIQFADSEEIYILSISGNQREVNQAMEVLDKLLPWLLGMIILLSAVTAVLYAAYITRPIVRISKSVQKMAGLDFKARCEEKRTDEIGFLANSFNDLSDRLSKALSELQEANESLLDDIEKERKIEKQRLEFFSSVSHELKTPITILKGQMEGMISQVGAYQDRDKYLRRCYQTVGRMEEMVSEILKISKMESADFTMNPQEFSFKEVIEEEISLQESLYRDKAIQVEWQQPDDVIMTGDRQLLQRVVSNIFGNAVRYSPENSTIYLNMWKRSDKVCLNVENTGIHLPEESIPQLFQAFFRVEKSRNRTTGGSGLGLYIVMMIVKLHGGDCTIGNTDRGVMVKVVLPAGQEG